MHVSILFINRTKLFSARSTVRDPVFKQLAYLNLARHKNQQHKTRGYIPTV